MARTKARLKALHDNMLTDIALPLADNARLVFGEGNADARVVFIGEAPGAREDELGRPFVGRSGMLLTKWIESIGWHREEVYITNIVKRRPPDNRDPLPEELAAYRPYLTEQITIIAPRVIVPLGRFATNYFLPLARISKDQGCIFYVNGSIVMPVFHPAAALRSTRVRKQTEETFKKLKRVVEQYEYLVASATQLRAAGDRPASPHGDAVMVIDDSMLTNL